MSADPSGGVRDGTVLGATAPRETAYYYPEPYWLAEEGGWIKSLLLFFDEIAILLPSYMQGRNLIADPTLAGPLMDRKLLRVLQPETFVDGATAAQLTAVVEALMSSGSFDDLEEPERLASLSMSRMGFGVLDEVAQRVYAELARRGLATGTDDGLSIPLHPLVRSVYLLLLAQLSRETGTRAALDLHPVTNGRGSTDALGRFLGLAPMPSRGRVVAFDLVVVTVDLAEVPLDDVLRVQAASTLASIAGTCRTFGRSRWS